MFADIVCVAVVVAKNPRVIAVNVGNILHTF